MMEARWRWRDRRRFLADLLLGLLAVCAGALSLGSRAALADPLARVLALSGDRERARRVGRVLLQKGHVNPPPGSARERRPSPLELLDSMLGGGWQRAIGDCDDGELRRRLEARCRRDFAERRVVQLEGWLIARTEADFCILAALVSGATPNPVGDP